MVSYAGLDEFACSSIIYFTASSSLRASSEVSF